MYQETTIKDFFLEMANIIHSRNCKSKCEKILILPETLKQQLHFSKIYRTINTRFCRELQETVQGVRGSI